MKSVIIVMMILAAGYITGMEALMGGKLSTFGPGILICAFLIWRLIVVSRRDATQKENEKYFNEYMRNKLRKRQGY